MPLNVAAIGIGNHAQRNTLPALAECESVNLLGIYTRNMIIAEQVAHRYHCKFYKNESEILEDKNVDAVYIALPVGLHAEWGMKSIQAGKHLWCEKSLTHESALSQQLIEEAKIRDVCVCECFMYMHHPEFKRLENIMLGEEIGPIQSIKARFGFPHIDPENFRYDKDLGGGALLDNGCYLLHAVRQLSLSMPEQIHSSMYIEKSFNVDTSG